MMNGVFKQPWIRNASFDGVFILLPPFLALGAVWLFPDRFKNSADMPLIGWCILILFIDVAHVYSTLYNTYFDKARFARQKNLFIIVPVACYVIGMLLHMFGSMVFWRTIAYLAVFHFIRQQYGFMRLYARGELQAKWSSFIDTMTVYAATLYPLVYWHCTPSRNFNWFVDDDFVIVKAGNVKNIAFVVYITILIIYVFKELFQFAGRRYINVPKNILIVGTAVSWYFGIVYFNGDMAFTMLNVVSHGIPYMALVWYNVKKKDIDRSVLIKQKRILFVHCYGILVFLGSLIFLAYIEEGLWDGLVWREHTGLFSLFSYLPHVSNDILLAMLVPLLSLPQSTHYVLDGFIWRKKYS